MNGGEIHGKLPEEIISFLQNEGGHSLIVKGSAGTGKTTCAIILAKEIFGDRWKENFEELNASDERGIEEK